MENVNLHGFRIRMAVFAKMVNEMIVAELADNENSSDVREPTARRALAPVNGDRSD